MNYWQTSLIRLRAIEPGDADIVHAWNQDSDMARHLDCVWSPQSRAPALLQQLVERIRAIENRVAAVVLAFGRCRTLHQLPDDFKVPVLYPSGEDCIGVLLGQERYLEELYHEAGTWFLSPGWAELGMEFIFHEVQASGLARRGIDPMKVARRMLNGYKRALLIDTGVGDRQRLRERAKEIADLFNWRVDTVHGSLTLLEDTLKKAPALDREWSMQFRNGTPGTRAPPSGIRAKSRLSAPSVRESSLALTRAWPAGPENREPGRDANRACPFMAP